MMNRLIYRYLQRRYRPAAQAYLHPAAPEQLLFDILQANRSSEYGRRYDFGSIRSVEQYQSQVPLIEYSDLEPAIARIAQGESQVLTSEAVRRFEPTGGSSGSAKWIPYTESLNRQFQRSVEAWLYDIYTNYPGVAGGQSYWMLTPPIELPTYDSVVPVGFQSDAEYLGSWGARVLNRLMLQPKLHSEMSTAEFYQATLSTLLQAPDLRLISIWNPSLLLEMLRFLEEDPDRLLRTLPIKRRQAIRKSLYQHDYCAIWPNLALISCWADAAAESQAKVLAQRFPGVSLQPKGLLSTECIVSFPTRKSLAHGGMLPAIHSTFLEFLQEDRVYTYDQLVMGESYQVVVTTGGGLYRYRTGDRVKITGRYRGVPLLRFDGRDQTVDRVGEKLTPGLIQSLFSDHSGFYLLAPKAKHYVFYTDQPIASEEVEARLASNFHYALARKLGQLDPARVWLIEGNAEAAYLENCRRQQQRLGDIKPQVLSGREDFEFLGAYYD